MSHFEKMYLNFIKIVIHQRFYRVYYVFGFILILGVYCMITVHFQKTLRAYDENRIPKKKEESCHVSRKDDGLPLLHTNDSMPEKSIFFLETSCKGGLSSRQACAVESAARAHPDHQINVLFTSAVTREKLDASYLVTLTNHYKNVKLARVYVEDYANGTPLALPVKQMLSHDNYVHISDVMKFLTMYKYSGIYLGFDAVVARSFSGLWKNWAIRETPVALSSEMFSFSRNKVGRKLAELAVSSFLNEFSITKEQNLWSYNGLSVLTNVLQTWCSTTQVQVMSLATCDDLAVYGPELFYPISFYDRQTYFNAAVLGAWKDQRIYTYFVWERFTKHNMMNRASLFWKIATEYCPMVSSRYGRDLGLIEP